MNKLEEKNKKDENKILDRLKIKKENIKCSFKKM